MMPKCNLSMEASKPPPRAGCQGARSPKGAKANNLERQPLAQMLTLISFWLPPPGGEGWGGGQTPGTRFQHPSLTLPVEGRGPEGT